MKNYTAGLYVAGVKLDMDDNHVAYKIEKSQLSFGNKIFDYIDAGLPVITAFGGLIRRLLKRYGIGIFASDALFTNPSSLLEGIHEKKKRVAEARENYSIKRLV